ncbi:hypothetical protein F0L68_14580 [Solihabitans fulvus]|uniref:Zinc finger CGNR domain-containing protein n=2 Tax=Solihabitans fulvus TaxID=1892852 RepID=A0A5B2XGN5_9PSEU|nr:hypothetical protein F0L68_14580 [Solihabitans fulvus]
MDAGVRHDLLESVEGLAAWLAGPTVERDLRGHAVRADRATLDALLEARDALATLVGRPEDPAGAAALNAVLHHGCVRPVLGADGPVQVVEVDTPAWLPAWVAAENYLRLLDDRPDRIRPCGNPECVLYFYDVSKSGTRRWCSMTACGNRAKASRHYTRHHQS